MEILPYATLLRWKPTRTCLKSKRYTSQILRSEIEYALEIIETCKDVGPGQILIDVIKFFDGNIAEILLDLINAIYEKG